MQHRIKAYVASFVAAATVGIALVATYTPVTGAPLRYLVWLAIIALVAEAVALLLPSGAASSLGSIPLLSIALISPDWIGVTTITLTGILAQPILRRGWLKATFNVAQMAVAVSVAVGVYHLLGGKSMLDTKLAGFLNATWGTGLPAMALIWIYFGLNTAAVSGAIAISSGKSPLEVWRHGHLSTLAYEFLSSPFVFLFAWVTVRLGPLGAVLVTIPALGLRQLYKTKLDLERSHQDMLELMVKAIEARDPYTSGHSRRVQHYSMVIARVIDLTDREVQRIGVAALLHDVGKIHEKYAPLLRKPDSLTPEEWRIMEEHPVDGATLVATAGQLRDLVPLIRHHHERWDGHGYPDKLKADQIPLASRVITFADTIDAMTTARPYRGPLSEQQVKEELVRCRGKQFDPAICDALLASPLWSLLFAPSKPASDGVRAPSKFSIVRGERAVSGAG